MLARVIQQLKKGVKTISKTLHEANQFNWDGENSLKIISRSGGRGKGGGRKGQFFEKSKYKVD